MAGHQDRPALRGPGPEQVAHPPDALRVQPIRQLVEDQHLRVPEQRRRDAETLAHAEGVAPERPVTGYAEPDKLKHLIRPRQRDARGLADDAQVIAPGPVLMRRACLKDRATRRIG